MIFNSKLSTMLSLGARTVFIDMCRWFKSFNAIECYDNWNGRHTFDITENWCQWSNSKYSIFGYWNSVSTNYDALEFASVSIGERVFRVGNHDNVQVNPIVWNLVNLKIGQKCCTWIHHAVDKTLPNARYSNISPNQWFDSILGVSCINANNSHIL